MPRRPEVSVRNFRPGSVFRGITWSGVSQAGRQSIQLVVTIVLARLLTPADFGIIAMATAVTGLVAIFGDLGTSAAVIQKADHSPQLLSTIFWLNLGFGVLVMLAVAGIAPLAAMFYSEPRLTAILLVLSTAFPLAGLGILQQSLLERALNFNVLARIELAASVIGGAAAVAFAAAGGGIWSLVLQTVVTPAVTSLLLWLHSEWRPSAPARLAEVRSIAGFSANITGFNVVNYFARNADYILIGRFLGSTELGFYTLAYRILMFPLQNLSTVLIRVTFPVFSQLQDDDSRFRSAYLRTVVAIALVTFPLMAFLFVVAEPLIGRVFGAEWLPSVPLILIFAPIGLVQSVSTTVGSIYMAKARAELLLKWGIGSACVVITSFVIGLRWGIVGVAASYAIASFALAYPGMAIPLRLIQLKVTAAVAVLWRPLACALIMAAAVFAGNAAFYTVVDDWKLLAIDGVIALLSYAGTSLIINRQQLELIRDMWSSAKKQQA